LVSERTVDEYYARVKNLLKEMHLWEEAERRFKAPHIKNLVRKILEKYEEAQVDPQYFDWKPVFANILSYDSLEKFYKREVEPKLPKPKITEMKEKTEEAYITKETSYLEAQLMSLIEDARTLHPELGAEILKRARERIAEALGQIEDLDRLYLEVSRLKEEARRERAKAREYKAKTQELEKELRKLYEEISALRQQLEEAKKAQKRYIYKMVALKAVTHIPSFLGEDGKVYGPFEAGQIFNVPERDAHKLISRGLAQPWKPTAFPPEAPKPPKKEINPEIKVKTDTLWEQYINAVLSHEPIVAMEAARQLREFRKKLFT